MLTREQICVNVAYSTVYVNLRVKIMWVLLVLQLANSQLHVGFLGEYDTESSCLYAMVQASTELKPIIGREEQFLCIKEVKHSNTLLF